VVAGWVSTHRRKCTHIHGIKAPALSVGVVSGLRVVAVARWDYYILVDERKPDLHAVRR